MNNSDNTPTRGGIGLTGLALLWGLITQALSWAGVIDWPWYAMWGPFLIMLGVTVAILVFIGLCALIAALLDR